MWVWLIFVPLQRKERQKLKKQDDRRGEKSRYSEVKKLLKLSPKVTKTDTLEEGEYGTFSLPVVCPAKERRH